MHKHPGMGLRKNKNGIAFAMPSVCARIRQPARPCWNGGIWYMHTHDTEYHSQWP